MDRPGERGEKREKPPFSFFDFPKAKELVAQKKKREDRAQVAQNAGEMITGRLENERSVIEQVSQPLNGPVKIRGRRVEEKKMLEGLRDELPAANERIAQDQGGIVPDKLVPERRRIERQGDENQNESRQNFFNGAIRLDRSNKMRV